MAFTEKTIGSRLCIAFAQIILIYGVFSTLFLYSLELKGSYSPNSLVDLDSVPEQLRPFHRELAKRKFQKEHEQLSKEHQKQKMQEDIREREASLAPFNDEIDRIVSESLRLKSIGQWDEAYNILNKSLHRWPNSDKIATQMGGWYFDKNQFDIAEKYYRMAHHMNPLEGSYISNMALCLSKLNRGRESLEVAKLAYDLDPSYDKMTSLFEKRLKINEWSEYHEQASMMVTETRKRVESGQRAINPYEALHYPFGAADMQKICANHLPSVPHDSRKVWTHPTWDGKRRIRVGYVSPDLRNHAVGIQVQNMFRFADRTKFEIFAYNCHPTPGSDHIHSKIKAEAEHWVDLNGLVADIAQRVNDDKIDILFDFALFTAYHRMDLFALRAVPIQVAFLGLATTTGAKYYDYVIGDKVASPPQFEKYYSEKLVIMPNSYHIFDHKQYYPNPGVRGGGIQLSDDNFVPSYAPPLKDKNTFVFCNFQNNYRLEPVLFYHWMKIVQATPNSTLALKYYNDESMDNIVKAAKHYGVELYHPNQLDNEDRHSLIFVKGSGKEHIQMKSKICDMFLDCHWYNGHSSGGDMLWAGVPVVSYPAETMASRAVASFITTMGEPQLVANSWKDYVEKAVHWATNRDEYEKLRTRIEKRRETNGLFDTEGFVRDLEKAMLEMMHIHHIEKNPPRKIIVKP